MVQSIEDARRRQGTTSSGRVPPHDLQAEESLLGAMLLSRDAIVEAVDICGEADFYKPAHGHVFEAVCSLYSQGEPADPVTVADELRRANLLESVGGPAALVSLQANTPAISNAPRYARIVEEHAILRRLIGVAGEIAELGYSVPEDVSAAVDQAEARVFEVAQRRARDSVAPLRDLLESTLDHLEALFERGEAITGVPTGFTDLDERLAGLQPSNLVIIGARPSTGKTAFALNMLAHAATATNQPVLLFSLEMSHHEIAQRLLCAEARVDASRMRNGRLLEADWPKIQHAIGRLGEAPIFVDDNPNVTLLDIRGRARRIKSREGLALVVIDYLQLMTGRNRAENRQVEVSEISRGLKILARELQVPVVALSQLSRNVEMRADKRPVLADLRESGCMPASTRLLRADTGEEVALGNLVLSQEQPLVWSLDDRNRMVPARLSRAFPSGIKPVFRLRLASGLEVDATANHPFLTAEGWTRLDALAPGSSVATPRLVPEPASAATAAAAAGWTTDELVLLAHLLGGGGIGPNGVKYATADEANKLAVETAARRAFGIEVQGAKRARTWQLRLPSPYPVTAGRRHPIRNWLEPHGLWGSRSGTRFLPESLFALPDDRLALFLHHLWATDGSLTLGRNARGPMVRTYYATTSRQLALHVQRALLRLAIRSRLVIARKAGSVDCWHVVVQSAPDQLRFLSLVGCHGAGGQAVAEARRVLDSAPLPDQATSDVAWDEVLEITALGEQPTFDATVPGTHNFVADGVIAHNSLEQDADVVMFLYRDELYNPESPDRGTAEVIVSKHRNGPTGVARLAFLEHYTRFANMARV